MSGGDGGGPGAGSPRVALVTGAAGGMGAATVRRLAATGYAVIALDWCRGDGAPDEPAWGPMASAEDLRVLADELNADGERVVPVVADVRDAVAVQGAVDEALRRWGRLDVVVAAAAVLLGGRPLWETPRDEITALWEIDALGVWEAVRAAVPAMLAGPDPAGCRVVAVASAAGSRGIFGLGAYTMVKHAVVGLVRALAADLVGTGVTAVAVAPGSTHTRMLEQTAAVYGIDDVDHFARHQLVERLLAPEEIASTIAFCCGRDAAVLNGGVVQADGGFRG